VATPDKRRTERVCHVNMLKHYVVRHSINSAVQTTTFCYTQLVDSTHDTELGPSCHESPDVNKFKLDNLQSNQRTQLQEVLSDFKSCFDDKPGRTGLTSHKISVKPGTRPIKLSPYRVNPNKAHLIKTELDSMLKLGVIEPSNSP